MILQQQYELSRVTQRWGKILHTTLRHGSARANTRTTKKGLQSRPQIAQTRRVLKAIEDSRFQGSSDHKIRRTCLNELKKKVRGHEYIPPSFTPVSPSLVSESGTSDRVIRLTAEHTISYDPAILMLSAHGDISLPLTVDIHDLMDQQRVSIGKKKRRCYTQLPAPYMLDL